jgi:archaeal flagellin FlaB
MKLLLKRIRKDQKGVTGLETAIILIAFVIVASVFAFVVLSAGLFSSQKTKEAVSAGIASATAVVELKGNVIAKMDTGVVSEIYLCVGLPSSGSSVDFSPPSTSNITPVVISYMDTNNMIPSVNWTLEKLSTVNNDNLLDPEELFRIIIILPSSGNISVGPYHTFSLELKPSNGPVLEIQRTIPARISNFVNLY